MNNLKPKELENLFIELLDNATHLLGAAVSLSSTEEKHISLALAELALEEIGKSFMCIAYYSKADTEIDWSLFWAEWKNHKVKAHRAFLYEFFSTKRLELENPPNYFPSKRQAIQLEKELAFYVDFDKTERKIIVPKLSIDMTEVVNRIASIFGVLNTGLLVKDLIKNKDSNYKKSVSEYAFLVMTTKISQQEAEILLIKLRDTIKESTNVYSDILKMFTI